MPLASVVAALGVAPSAGDAAIASAMRKLARLQPDSRDPPLWIHLLDWFTTEVPRPYEQKISDLGEIGFWAATWALPPDDVTWTLQRWANELDLPGNGQVVEEWVAIYVSDYLGPNLSRAGLLRAQPYEREPLELPRG
jgi:hypothetical protein